MRVPSLPLARSGLRGWLVAGLLAVSTAAGAQDRPLLTFEELDQDLHQHAITNHQPAVIMDINSDVVVHLNRDELRSVLWSRNPQALPPELTNSVRILQQALTASASGFEEFREKMANPAALSEEELKKVLASMADPALKIIDLADGSPELRARLYKVLAWSVENRASMAEKYQRYFQAASEHLKYLQRQMDEILKSEGVYVQLGGWLSSAGANRPIHLPGFDTNTTDGPFEYQRWVFNLSPEEADRYRKAAEAAGAIRARGISAWVKDSVSNTIPLLLSNLNCLAMTNLAVLSNDLASAPASLAAVPVQFQNVTNQMALLDTQIRGLIRKYEHYPLAQPEQLITLVAEARTDFLHLRDGIAQLHGSLATLAEGLKTASGKLSEQTQTVLNQVGSEGTHTVTTLLALIGCLSLDQANDALMEFTDAVLKHDLDSLPDRTEFSLIDTGPRQPGDRVHLRLAAGTSKRPGQPDSLESRRLLLHQPLWHTEVSAGLIFAHPAKSDTAVGNNFQAAPAISWLLKRDSRRHMVWNTLLDPGIGLQVSSLDFNHDDTPEFGVGGVVSIFRDYLQAGGGFNINERTPYFFFGLRFPLLPTLQTTRTQTSP